LTSHLTDPTNATAIVIADTIKPAHCSMLMYFSL
jgi:hypothetical protein